MKQKFNRGDIVGISRENIRFRVGERAVILNRRRNFSYEDENGNRLIEYEYEVIFIRNGADISYIEHSDLKFVRRAGEDFIKNLRRKHKIRRKNEVNLTWIVKNCKKIRENLVFYTGKLEFAEEFLKLIGERKNT